ncbi:MAG: ammonium transporter [Opitutae bacterium]|nr:ammonium transporter [Opitutae bacterium]
MKKFKHLTILGVWLRTITILPCIMLLTLPLAAQEDSTDVNGVTIESVASDQPLSNSAPTASKSPDTGNTAWMLTATALVLFMTLPGLALFYGGLVQSKNVLSVLMHCFTIACIASIIWVVCGYSLALTEGGEWIGGTERLFLNGLTADSLNGDFPESVWIVFQMTFAIITPGLIVGAFVERIKFSAMMIFSGLWLLIVYVPACYWVWGGGWLAKAGVIDFAGGIVVHATAGASALTIAAMLGKRQGFPKSLRPPHSPGLVMIGAAMLWVGWFGFNAGSAAAANGSAGMAMLVTHISAATASLVWMFVEWKQTGKPGLVGIVTGMVAGLATITPASGNVGPMGAIIIGATAGIVCYFACGIIKEKLNIDDSLDVAAVHGVGGILGTLMVAFLGVEGTFGGQGINLDTAGDQFIVQAKGCLAAIALSVVATYIIVKITSVLTGGIRVSEEDETMGLDQSSHGENGYNIQ